MLMPSRGYPLPAYEAPAAILPEAAPAGAEPPPFEPFAKIPRFARESTTTEKINGTNAQILVTQYGDVFAGSRTRWISPGKLTDNYGFAAWVEGNRDELLDLGPGKHFGEWWGAGIQSGYGLTERRFSLFNVARWRPRPEVRTPSPAEEAFIHEKACFAPACCDVVPVMYRGPFDTAAVDACLQRLRVEGSVAAPGFMQPEGVIIHHSSSGTLWKRLLVNDEGHKGTLH